MSYVKTLNTQQKTAANTIVAFAKEKGINNGKTVTAMLAVASKEGELKPVAENLKYSAKRIMEVWPSTPLNEALALANNPVALGNKKYGGKFGNGITEGYLFRGRGFNQITFKSRYIQIGKYIGVDLVKNPDLLLDPIIAAKAFVAYFILECATKKVDPNSPKTLTDALNLVYQANAGKIGKPINDTTGGYVKAKSRIDDLSQLVSEHKTATGGGVFFLILVGLAIWKRKEIKAIAQKIISKK